MHTYVHASPTTLQFSPLVMLAVENCMYFMHVCTCTYKMYTHVLSNVSCNLWCTYVYICASFVILCIFVYIRTYTCTDYCTVCIVNINATTPLFLFTIAIFKFTIHCFVQLQACVLTHMHTYYYCMKTYTHTRVYPLEVS